MVSPAGFQLNVPVVTGTMLNALSVAAWLISSEKMITMVVVTATSGSPVVGVVLNTCGRIISGAAVTSSVTFTTSPQWFNSSSPWTYRVYVPGVQPLTSMPTVTPSVAVSNVPSCGFMGVPVPSSPTISTKYSAAITLLFPSAASSTVALRVTVAAPAVGSGVTSIRDVIGPAISGSTSPWRVHSFVGSLSNWMK